MTTPTTRRESGDDCDWSHEPYKTAPWYDGTEECDWLADTPVESPVLTVLGVVAMFLFLIVANLFATMCILGF